MTLLIDFLRYATLFVWCITSLLIETSLSIERADQIPAFAPE